MGFTPDFEASLNRLLADYPGLTIKSGYRSPERQAQLWANALRKYGSESAARKWVAPPGRSYHNNGMAADLGYASEAQREQVHRNAERYGLYFPMGHEPWHIEPIGSRGADELRGGSSADSLVGGIRDGELASDKITEAPVAKPVKFDPLPQTSGHTDAVSRAGHESLSPSSQRAMVASSLRLGGGRGGIFGSGLLSGGVLSRGSTTSASTAKTKTHAPKVGDTSAGINIPANSAEEIARLSSLSPLDYERERARIADEWGVRIQTIDTAVNRHRKDNKPAKTPSPGKTKIPVASQEKMLENARRLVADGTPRNMVEDSLRKLGIDPGLL